jgi:hypothetical protein
MVGLLAVLLYVKQQSTAPSQPAPEPVPKPEKGPKPPDTVPPPIKEKPKPPTEPAPETKIEELTLFERFLKARAYGERTELPDYSYAGYHRSEKPLPEITPETHRFFNVSKFGAVPNDGKSDRDALLDALDAAHIHNGPAVVYFPKGTYRLFEETDFGKPPIEIRRSNIVIKGSGMASTRLFFSETHLPAP